MKMAGQRCYGFETQPTQVEHLDMTVPRYVERLEALGFDHFVVLERKNHLRRIVSMLVARTTSQWHLPPGDKHPLVRVELDVDNLLLARGRDTEGRSLVAQLLREQESARALRDVLANRRLLCLTYEDDIAIRPASAYQRVCEFTGMGDHPVTVRFSKTNPHELTDVLTNFSQVEQSLRGTPFEWMLYS
jgi:hypothetical protein